MYKKLKQIVRAFIPKRFLFKYELFFRSFFYPFYKGGKYKCTICTKGLRKFLLLENGAKICPSCGSLPRNRRLWNVLDSQFLKEGISILDFSPSRNIYRMLKNNPSVSYTSTDLSGDFLSDQRFDITNISSKYDTYDLIICYHILEHVENDRQAMKELHRVLKKGGSCIIQTPFKEGNTYEDFSIKSDKARLKYFGQEDHVRIYSVSGLTERLSDAGFQVDLKEYKEAKDNKFGYKEEESILICRK